MSETHTIDVKEMQDGSGDAYIEFPPALFKELGWKEGDDLKFVPKEDGSFLIKKVKYGTVELDFDNEELLKYMTLAHERGQSFNEFVQEAVISMITEHEECNNADELSK